MPINTTTLVFDLDGTLSDPSQGICRCINFALETHGFDAVPDNEITSEIGPPLDETFQKLAPDVSASQIQSLVTKFRERYAEVGYSENTIYPGVNETIARLSSAGLRLGVCTSKRVDFAEKILALFSLSPYFSFVDGGDIGIRKSQQLQSLIESGTIDTGAIMIGDRSVDILAARNNGLRSIGVLWGFGGLAELATAGADFTVKETSELVQLII